MMNDIEEWIDRPFPKEYSGNGKSPAEVESLGLKKTGVKDCAQGYHSIKPKVKADSSHGDP